MLSKINVKISMKLLVTKNLYMIFIWETNDMHIVVTSLMSVQEFVPFIIVCIGF